MPVVSAGILLHRRRNNRREVFLIHPGGPYWSGKDSGAWSIPKGIVSPEENPLAAAKREFREETGFSVRGRTTALGTFRQPTGKRLLAWAIEGDFDPAKLASNSFAMIWPPGSGRSCRFPEADRGAWFTRKEAMVQILPGQQPILDALFQKLRHAKTRSEGHPSRPIVTDQDVPAPGQQGRQIGHELRLVLPARRLRPPGIRRESR